MTARSVYPKGRKSARKTPYFHALGIVVEWKQRNDKLIREQSASGQRKKQLTIF